LAQHAKRSIGKGPIGLGKGQVSSAAQSTINKEGFDGAPRCSVCSKWCHKWKNSDDDEP
jgi:hypothetical protein